MDFQSIRKHATEVFSSYTANYDLSDTKILLKANHTYRVADFCEQIARSLNLSEEDVLIAWMCGLLHDIGRFEQVTRFNTFLDAKSVNHAHLSCEILFGTEQIPEQERCPGSAPEVGMMRQFITETEYDELIGTAIWWHSAYRYPDDISERQRMFCDILRDADKIDIFRVNVETPISEIHNIPLEDFYSASVTPEVFQAFQEHHCVLASLRKTPIDSIVSYMSLYWELVYERSRELAHELGYMRQLSYFESKNHQTKAIFSQIRKEIGLE